MDKVNTKVPENCKTSAGSKVAICCTSYPIVAFAITRKCISGGSNETWHTTWNRMNSRT